MKEFEGLLYIAVISFIIGIGQSYMHNKKIESDLALKEKVMYYGQFQKTMSILAVILTIILIIFLSLLEQWDEDGFIGVLAIIGLFLVAFIGWTMENFFVKIIFDDNELILESPWRKKRRVQLAELTGYQYSREGDYHVFTTEKKGKVRLSPHLKGITNFFILLDKRQSILTERLRAQLRFGNTSDS